MAVHSARSKGADSRSSRLRIEFWQEPIANLLLNVEGRIRKVDVRIKRLRMQRRNQLLMLELKQHFRHLRDTGRRLRMANV
ncbi:hypothetical protein D3C77_440090 [compost metagenome]